MTDTKKIKPKTLWHDWFGNLFKVSLIPTGLHVETDVPVMQKLPEADVVIIRRSGHKWTENQLIRLPDGIRHTQAEHVLIELKFTESINTDAICQIAGYYKFYKIQHKLTKSSDLKCFLVASKTPRKSTLQRFQYRGTRYSGVYKSKCPICGLFPIISLNDLSDASHNILFKLFASKKKESIGATKKVKSDLFEELPDDLRSFITDYINKCLITGGKDMDYLNLTQEEKKRLRQEWLSNYSASEMLANYTPSEVFANYTPSEVFANYTPSEVFASYTPPEILSNFTPDQIVTGLNEEQLKALSKLLVSNNKK